jgi:hypothetical protein
MSTFKSLASIALTAAILPALHAEPHCPGNVPSLRLRLVQRSQIIVPVTINHTGPYDFLVDTGAQVTTVDPALAAELHLKIEGTTGFVGVDFRTRPSFAHLDTLEAGSHATANPLVVIQNIEHLQAADPHIRGILGGNFLRNFDVLIDYARGMLCFDDTKVMQSEIKGKHIALVSPPHPEGGGLLTEPLIIPVHLSGHPRQATAPTTRFRHECPALVRLWQSYGRWILRKCANTRPRSRRRRTRIYRLAASGHADRHTNHSSNILRNSRHEEGHPPNSGRRAAANRDLPPCLHQLRRSFCRR